MRKIETCDLDDAAREALAGPQFEDFIEAARLEVVLVDGEMRAARLIFNGMQTVHLKREDRTGW